MSHPYGERSAFERLLVLIATLVRHPGIGAIDPNATRSTQHDAIAAVQIQLQAVAEELGIALPSYSVHTLRKDLKTLRRYGILENRMYRWGYYLGTGAMSAFELRVALQAIAAQAQHQGNPLARRVYERLERRLRGLDLALDGQLFYPVRTQLDRAITHTDPEEMMRRGQYRHTLFHQLDAVEAAIASGTAIEIYCSRNPYGTATLGCQAIYPLQLVYHEIAWYLLYEELDTGHFVIERVDRLGDHCRRLAQGDRGLAAQREGLRRAQQLLRDGWGLYLGDRQQQRQELAGRVEFVVAIVRFFEPVMAFILEGELRHPQQELHKGKQDGVAYVDYQVRLPARSLPEFGRWVNRFMQFALVLAPESLVKKHHQAAIELLDRYTTK